MDHSYWTFSLWKEIIKRDLLIPQMEHRSRSNSEKSQAKRRVNYRPLFSPKRGEHSVLAETRERHSVVPFWDALIARRLGEKRWATRSLRRRQCTVVLAEKAAAATRPPRRRRFRPHPPCLGYATFAATSDPAPDLAPKPSWVSSLYASSYDFLLLDGNNLFGSGFGLFN